jgi:hypothetical protein
MGRGASGAALLRAIGVERMRQENTHARQNKNSRCDIQHPTSPEARPYTRYMHSPIELRARCQHDSVRSGKGVVGWPRQSVASRGSSAGPRSRASVAESMTKPRQPNDAGLTVPCQVHVLAPIRMFQGEVAGALCRSAWPQPAQACIPTHRSDTGTLPRFPWCDLTREEGNMTPHSQREHYCDVAASLRYPEWSIRSA